MGVKVSGQIFIKFRLVKKVQSLFIIYDSGRSHIGKWYLFTFRNCINIVVCIICEYVAFSNNREITMKHLNIKLFIRYYFICLIYVQMYTADFSKIKKKYWRCIVEIVFFSWYDTYIYVCIKERIFFYYLSSFNKKYNIFTYLE